MNSNIDFLSVCLETILFSSIEITNFSSQLYFFLANIKSKLWQLYVLWRHHCQSTRGSYLPLLIFLYKGISALYLLYAKYLSTNRNERKIPWKVQLNPSSSSGGVVITTKYSMTYNLKDCKWKIRNNLTLI